MHTAFMQESKGKKEKMDTIAVVGAGTMGSSIAFLLVNNGYATILKDIDKSAVAKGIAVIDRLFESAIKKGLPTQEAEKRRSLLMPSTDYDRFSSLSIVIEAVSESLEIKKAVLAELDKICNRKTIFATNTSSLSITQLGAQTTRADKVVGMHFFNPAHLMKLIEVIPGLETAPDTVAAALNLGTALGKLAIRVEECASFLVNRLAGRYLNEALYVLQEGSAGIAEIDQAACDYVMPVGPLALRDMNGVDIGLAVSRYNYEEYGERFLPAPILQEMARQQWLGKKTGQGFYTYDSQTGKKVAVNPAIPEIIGVLKEKNQKAQFNVKRLFLPMINEAFCVLQEKICQITDLDAAMIAGMGMRKGPLELAEDIGLNNCLAEIERLYKSHGERFRPAPLLKRYVWAGREKI